MTKADNNTFIDEHFVQDSVLVLLKGAFLSSVIETLCLKAPVLTGGQPVGFCQEFAPEFVAVVHLAKFQWTTDVERIWSNLNMFLFGGALFYGSRSPTAGIRNAVTSMAYYQAAQRLKGSAASYRTETKQQDKKRGIEINGVSSGLTAGGLSLLFAYKNTLQYRPCTLLAPSVGTVLVTAFFYAAFGGSEKMSYSRQALAVAAAITGAVAGAIVGAAVGATTGTVVGAIAILLGDDGGMYLLSDNARAASTVLALTGAVIGAGALSLDDAAEAVTVTADVSDTFVGLGVGFVIVLVFFEQARAAVLATAATTALVGVGIVVEAIAEAITETVAGAIAEAAAGAGIIMMTGCISSTLFQSSGATTIRRGLTVTAAAGLPLMVSSWLVSLERFAEDSVTMHETMQNEFMFSLPVSKALSPANWVNWPTVRAWFTD